MQTVLVVILSPAGLPAAVGSGVSKPKSSQTVHRVGTGKGQHLSSPSSSLAISRHGSHLPEKLFLGAEDREQQLCVLLGTAQGLGTHMPKAAGTDMLGWRSCYQLLELTGARQDQSKFYYLKGRKKKDTWDLHERTALFQALIREADI